MWETCIRSLGWEDPLEKGTATHSSVLSWRIPWNCQESDGTDRLSHSHTHSHWERCPDMFLLKSKNERVSHSAVSDSLRPRGLQPARLFCPWDAPGKNNEVGCHSLLQGIFLTQGLNPGLPHCRQILYDLSHQGSLRRMYYSRRMLNDCWYLIREDLGWRRWGDGAPRSKKYSIKWYIRDINPISSIIWPHLEPRVSTLLLLLLTHFSRVRLCATP